MTVRCKFRCDTVSPQGADGSVQEVTLSAVVGGSLENEAFFKWTPSGFIRFGTVNAAAAKQFEPGKVYHVDFMAAE